MGIFESLLVKLLPFIIVHVPKAAGWVVGIIVKAVLGEQAKSWLKDHTQRKACVAAMARSAIQVAREFPELASSFFDEHFLRSTISEELGLFLTRDQTPSITKIVAAYEKQFSKKPKVDVAPAATRFLALVEENFKKEKGLQGLLTHRQVDEGIQILRRIEQRRGVSTFGPVDDFITARVVNRETPSIDPAGVITAFEAASQDLLCWPQTLDGGQWMERPELAYLAKRISTTEHSVSLILGSPGSGKSALLARLAKDSIDKGFAILAIKADQIPEEITSLYGLRLHYELPADVLDCVRGIARDRKVVIIVDQLDALSELVDLKTRRLTVLLQLINQVIMIENVHIVSSCRVFERTYDKRLNSIEAEEVHLALPPWVTIEKLLQERHVTAIAWPEAFREILRVPQCLKLFLRHFCGTGESLIFKSYQAMLEQLWISLFSMREHREDCALVYDIATEMAEREVLYVSAAKYDEQRRELDHAVSEGILQYDRTKRQISFVHQTLFDFAWARAFVAKEHSLSRYVLERQTGLFVRPKLWSALHYFRGSDQEAYRKELETIWGAKDLRPHIRMLLIDYVGHQEQPLDFEIRLLRPMFSDPTYGANAFATVAGRKAWFDVIAGGELPDVMRASPERAWVMVKVLDAAWPFAKARVLELISRLWVPERTKHDHAWYTLRALQEWDRDALNAALSIIEQGTVSNNSVHDLATIISASAPDLAPALVGAQLKKQVREAEKTWTLKPEIPEDATDEQRLTAHIEHHGSDTFRKILEANNEWYELAAIAQAAPVAFLMYVWPPVREVIEKISLEDTTRTESYRSDNLTATDLETDEVNGRNIAHPLVDSLVYAVRGCAKQDFASYRRFLKDNILSNALTVHRLIAIGLCEAASQEPMFALDYLLGDERRLLLGNSFEDERETKMLLRVLIPHISNVDCGRLEAAILNADMYRNITPEREPKDRLRLQQENRLFRLRLLRQFPKERLFPRTRELVESELRIFPDFKDRRRGFISWTSVSPMSGDEMVRASDKTIEEFLGAFRDATEWGDPFGGHGGSIEVSRAFAQFAQKEPQRAIKAILRLDHATQQRPAAYAIRELTENELADETLFDLVFKLDGKGFDSEEFRECVADALLKRVKKPRGLPDPIIDLLERWLDEYKIESTTGETEKNNGDEHGREEGAESLLWGYRGAYGLPGGSYRILNALFFGLIIRVPVSSERILGILKKHVARSDRIEVWNALAFDTLRRLRFCDREGAQDFLTILFATYPTLLGKSSGMLLVASTLGWVSHELTRGWIERIYSSGWKRSPQAYGELLGLRAVLVKEDQWSRREIDRILARGPAIPQQDPKILCGIMHAAANLWNDVDDRTLLTRILCIGMNSHEKDVAVAAIDWFRTVDDLRLTDDTHPVLDAFASGKALEAAVSIRSYSLDRLSDIIDDAPDLVYTISRRIIDIFKDSIGNFATAAVLESETLISIAITLQRREEPHRTRGLELFESLLHYNAYKVRDVLMDIDRRPGVSVPVSQIRRRRREGRPRAKRG